LLKVNKEPAMIIDLHRDAASYTGNIGKTVLIDGKTSATFALVVGQGNENAGTLNILANDISNKAEELYPGFGGRIISKPYKYNQSVANCCVLLEVGNNENNIREANICAEYLAVVLDEVIKERKINI